MLGLDKQSRLNRQLRKAAKKGSAADIHRLLDEGAEIESRGNFQWGGGALHIAAFKGNITAAAALLDRGADIEATDNEGETPLMNALIREKYKFAAFLLDRGASVNIAGPRGRTPLSLAGKSGDKELVRRIAGESAVVAASPTPVKPVAQAPVTRVENLDEVVLFRARGNRLLEESFNFASKERITLLRNGMDGPVEAMTRDSFSAIDDKQQLRYAFGLYKQQGGKLAEEEVFPDALGKKPLPGRQP